MTRLRSINWGAWLFAMGMESAVLWLVWMTWTH